MQLAANEMFRVLKPGGRVVTSVWDGPEKNFWVTAIGGTINRNMELPSPPPEAPGMFRCAKTGLIEDLFRNAGAARTSVDEVNIKLSCGTADVYWNMMTEVAAPFVAALSKADDAMRTKIKSEVLDIVNQRFNHGDVTFDGTSLVIYGKK